MDSAAPIPERRDSSASQGFVHDESLWPVVATQIPSRAFDDEVRAHMRYIDGLYARGEPFLSITFVTLSTRVTSDQRQMMNAWMAATQQQMVTYNRGSLMVSGSTVFRFVRSGLMRVNPLPLPYQVVNTAPEGEHWLRECATKAGLALPADFALGLRRLQHSFEGT